MSLPNILMEVEMFGDESEADGGERHRKDLCWILEALTQRNMTYLSEHPDAPRLYRSGVTYSAPNQTNREAVPELAAMLRVIDQRKLARDPDAQAAWQRVIDVFGGERFRDVPNILRNGGGDCDNMNCWRAAELRLAGIPASPYVTSRHQGNRTIMHAIVEHPDGTAEDPSRILGMGGSDGDSAAKRAEENRKNDERRAILATGIRRKVESGLLLPDAGVVALDTIVGIFPTAKERVALGLA